MGVLAYQMSTGQLPYRAASLPELLGAMLHTTPPPPATLAAGVPVAASDAIVRALAASPAARFERVRDLAAALS
jgi:serine/threonine-protein kinase